MVTGEVYIIEYTKYQVRENGYKSPMSIEFEEEIFYQKEKALEKIKEEFNIENEESYGYKEKIENEDYQLYAKVKKIKMIE